MIRQFLKSQDERLSENFWLREFHCPCASKSCLVTYLSEELIEGLQKLRDMIGPIDISSGFRCEEHNDAIGGHPNSQHKLGIAADCIPLEKNPRELKRAATKVLCFSKGGIGLYSWGCHLDVRGTMARWSG